MARRPKFRKVDTLLPRILSALVLAPLALGIIYLGPPYSLVFGGIIALGLLVEWAVLCVKNHLSGMSRPIVILLGTAYISLACLWLLHLLTQEEGWKILYWLLFLVWSTDISAYIGGRVLRGPKLAPSISPKKTWAGFFSGMVGGSLVAYFTSFWLIPHTFSVWNMIWFVFIAQTGDLIESKAKRWSDAEDSSFLIPGHGGLLDRLDSLLAVSLMVALEQLLK